MLQYGLDKMCIFPKSWWEHSLQREPKKSHCVCWLFIAFFKSFPFFDINKIFWVIFSKIIRWRQLLIDPPSPLIFRQLLWDPPSPLTDDVICERSLIRDHSLLKFSICHEIFQLHGAIIKWFNVITIKRVCEANGRNN